MKIQFINAHRLGSEQKNDPFNVEFHFSFCSLSLFNGISQRGDSRQAVLWRKTAHRKL